jgi:hypothetical protein
MATAPHLANVVGAALYAITRVESLKPPVTDQDRGLVVKAPLPAWEKLSDKQKAPYLAAAQWLNTQPPGCVVDRDALALRLFDAQKASGAGVVYNPRLAVEVWASLKAAFRAG